MAFLQEHLDNTLKNSDDIERFLASRARSDSVARIVWILTARACTGWRRRSRRPTHDGNGTLAPGDIRQKTWIRIDGNGTHHSALSEAFRGLRTSVLLSAAGVRRAPYLRQRGAG